MLVFEEGEKNSGTHEKKKILGARTRTNNKLDPHMTPSPGIEPETHWWKASVVNIAPSLLPEVRRWNESNPASPKILSEYLIFFTCEVDKCGIPVCGVKQFFTFDAFPFEHRSMDEGNPPYPSLPKSFFLSAQWPVIATRLMKSAIISCKDEQSVLPKAERKSIRFITSHA